ncbi:MAG: NAD(P)H-dependent oxidoreductase subunit E [Chloroflexi bacterium]|jgi:NADH:ubiquinone oxidoreductase subunit E|nr:NAD(P)H-dependent oxidoreductase subunit E [Chloroflexota bacterium]MBT7081648.1 NAD(P)H-dependent oxidoreductase subunit E [Chloroflexota bacterium]MBT7289321.1 NAD(P)H-dependent oxidoreductase subunit E [Chloroflexota bacterium]
MVNAPPVDINQIKKIINDYKDSQWPVMPMVEHIQDEIGYIPPQTIPMIAKAVGLFPSQVQSIVTFHDQLYTEPRGKNVVRVCRGTACHVRGGKAILKSIKGRLGLEDGQTSEDFEYTLETVSCMGMCAVAPNMTVGKNIYGNMNLSKVDKVFKKSEG